MLVVGIDPGTAITGYGIVHLDESGVVKPVEYGVILTKSGTEMPDRLLKLYIELKEILNKHKLNGSAVEKLFFQRNVRTAIAVGQARGVALLALAECGLSVSEYAPLEIKQAVTGYGGADKKQVQQMVKVLLGLNEIPQPDDAADALAVAICHIHSDRINAMYGANGV